MLQATYTFNPLVSSFVYNLIMVELLPPAPAALVDIGFSAPSLSAAARRLCVSRRIWISAYPRYSTSELHGTLSHTSERLQQLLSIQLVLRS